MCVFLRRMASLEVVRHIFLCRLPNLSSPQTCQHILYSLSHGFRLRHAQRTRKPFDILPVGFIRSDTYHDIFFHTFLSFQIKKVNNKKPLLHKKRQR